MGYTIKIGQREVNYDAEDNYEFISCENVRLEDAPAFGEPSDYINERWPSHEGWGKFTKVTGLYELFYNSENGLFRENDAYPITQSHMAVIDAAYAAFILNYPNATPGISPKDDVTAGGDPNWPDENRQLARLVWLRFWFDWALKNCSEPVIYNG